jgi:A118 family predicted phage portal protein
MHVLDGGTYKIINKFFDKKTGQEIENFGDVESVIYTNSKIPFFQIITPNIINNVDFSNPMGISVFSNSIDILKGIDLIFDSYQNEFRLGKKRIIVPVTMAQMISDGVGVTPVFDDNDTEFYAIKANDNINDIKEINMTLRSNEHEVALKRCLDLLSLKCGLGSGRYNYNNSSLKTATEVISEKSELYENLKKHQLVMEKALIDLVYAICRLKGISTDFEVTIYFDDSVIEDSYSISKRMLEEYKNGVIDDVEYFMKVYSLTEEQAIKKSERINERIIN